MHEELFTVAEETPHGLHPVVFGVYHDVDYLDECVDGFGPDSTLRPRWHGVHGGGFVALSRAAAEYYAPLLQEQVRALGPGHAARRLVAVPLHLPLDARRPRPVPVDPELES